MDDLEFLKKLSDCNDKEQMARCIENHKPMTNADRIRAMSDEELAEFRAGEHCPPTIRFPDCATLKPCRKCWLEWLQQPAEEGA